MKRRDFLKAGAATVATGSLGAPAIAQSSAKTLRFVPQANLANPDPIWTTATVAINHGYMVWDTLYGIDNAGVSHPQMLTGAELSDDKLTWTFALRDGLLFHDNEPVRGIDCVTSIARWSKRDPFGQQLASQTEEMKPLGDNKFTIRLKKPFPLMTYALGADGCFIMPERIASTDAFKQISEYTGSGPFRFLKDEWVSGAKAAWAKFDKYNPRAGGARLLLRRQARLCRPRRMAGDARPLGRRRGLAARRDRLGGMAADRPDPDAEKIRWRADRDQRPARRAGHDPVQPALPAVRQSEAAPRAVPCDRSDGSSWTRWPATRPTW